MLPRSAVKSAMAGGTPEHAALAIAVAGVLHGQLRGGPCRIFSSDLCVRAVDADMAAYPDLTIVCGEVLRDPLDKDVVIDPTVLVEVLSPSTELFDRNEKREAYQTIASLREYVLVSQSEKQIEVWRSGE